jgi:glutathione S-transferase
MVEQDDAGARAELLLLAPSVRVPRLTHGDIVRVGHPGHRRIPQRDQTQGRPAAGRPRRPRPLPLHLRRNALRIQCPALGAAHEPQGRFPNFTVWSRARRHRPGHRDLARLPHRYGGPYLFGAQRTMADAMYAPVVTRFLTYDVPLDEACAGLLRDHHGLPEMKANGSPMPSSNRTTSKSWKWSSESHAGGTPRDRTMSRRMPEPGALRPPLLEELPQIDGGFPPDTG